MLLLYQIENNFEIMNETQIFERNEIKSNYIIKSNIGKEKNKILLQYTFPILTTMYIFTFDFDLYQSSDLKALIDCMEGSNLINIKYFNYIDHFVCSCKNVNSISLIKITNISISNFAYRCQAINTPNCTDFINYDVIFLLYKGEYNLITNFLCIGSTTQVFNFPYYLHNENYNFPSDEPDSSYFFSNYTTIKQIKTTIPTTIKQIKTTIPTTIMQIKTTVPTTIKQIKTIFPTTIKQIKTTIPTTIKQIKATIPSTIKQIKTTVPTTIKQIKTTMPRTIFKEIETTSPFTVFKQMKTTIFKASTPISEVNCKLKCLSCNTDSSLLNLCIRCNTNNLTKFNRKDKINRK